ncbi:hypothetical protein PUNSTDRAFT_52608 [Punctularia strigosozonata HHB-11173 SS5]|uniref:uncharacterized protein n=1 Tax=Punctularia strigosozonata (strain HHB-11173) TaxID=741275 RepID=UPI0004417330|nr:uncharacterized protein PUNSTDRAFT_52608 [Punctularia strigosozonata HHB-11173 SS5]EIN08130.1 hypothetical protein PUNSTDRAFT_52608 [Punctularia strigosozonata HHB-11173 SS5]
MDHCPPEIAFRICEYACMDDGTTARSLSLVSTYLHDVSQPLQWRNVAVSGLKQARALLTVLDSSNHSRRKVIAHLLLSDRVEEYAVVDWYRHRAPRDEEDALRLREWNHERAEWREVQNRILSYAASTLKTLTALFHDPYQSSWYIQDALNFSYPVLEELTIRGSAWEPRFADDMTPETDHANVDLPSLRKIHLVGTGSFQRVIRQLAIRSPIISHLRLTGISRDLGFTTKLYAELHERGLAPSSLEGVKSSFRRRLQGEDSIVARDVDWPAILPAALELLVTQPMRMPPTTECRCCSGYAATEWVTHVLREIGKAQGNASDSSSEGESEHMHEGKGRRSTAFLYLPAARDLYTFADAKGDWVDGLSGGEGCWEGRRDFDLDPWSEESEQEDGTGSTGSF